MRPVEMNLRRAQPSESVRVKQWIKERHYTKRTPPGFVVALEFTVNVTLIGAMLLGRPAGKRKYPTDRILELTRMYFVDEAPKNTESRALSMMRKFIRTWFPQITLLIAYSDPAQGHEGTIYEADGWTLFGDTGKKTGYGWRSRPNRASDPVTPKLRWVRTP